MALRTRPPTGLASWPMILVDGPPKTGRSCTAYELSASERVGSTFVFPVGERMADEYKALGPYVIVELDGTWAGFYDQLVEATKMPMVDGKPNVIIIDTVTHLWGDLSEWTHLRARSSQRARALLARDPDAEIDPTSNYWNDAKARWANMLRLLAEWPGISILVARGEEVTAFRDGQPVAGESVYRVQVEKTTPSIVTANVRIPTYRTPTLVGVTSLGVTIPNGGMPLPKDGALEHLIFDVMNVTAENRQESRLIGAEAGGAIPQTRAKQNLAAVFVDAGWDKADAGKAAADIWHGHYPEGVTVDEVPVDVLADMVVAAEAAIIAATPPADPEPAVPEPTVPAPAPEVADIVNDTVSRADVDDDEPNLDEGYG